MACLRATSAASSSVCSAWRSCGSCQKRAFWALVMPMIGQVPALSLHISRATCACNRDTPLARAARRRAARVWLNRAPSVPVACLTVSSGSPAIGPGSLSDGLQRQPGEVAHAVQELRVAFLVARLLRGVGSEYHASADLSHITESGQQMEGQGQRMRLVEVVNGRATELFNHLGTADAKNYALGHPGCRFRVIQAVGDGAGEVVVFRNIGGQQIDGGSAEGLRRQTQYPDMYRMTIDADLGAQIRRL